MASAVRPMMFVMALLPVFAPTTLACDTPHTAPRVPHLAPLDLGAFRPLDLTRASHAVAQAFAAPAAPTGPEPHSLGPTHAGLLLDGLAPRESAALKLRPSAIERAAIFGTRAMVGMLERASARVARHHPGSVLWAGDLSLVRGGPFAPHASHQNGRDVDLAFYVSEPDGTPADGPAMRPVAPDGRVGGRVFDVTRNWALIEALIEDPQAEIQWVFVASHLRAMLLDAARAAGSPHVARAERILAEPRDSSPHVDHFHVRIYCSLDERLEGCLDAPPFHPWVDRHEDALARWLDGYLPFLETPRFPEIGHAVEAIVRMNATAALPHLEPLRNHADPAIAALADDACAFLRGHRTPAAWARWRALDTHE